MGYYYFVQLWGYAASSAIRVNYPCLPFFFVFKTEKNELIYLLIKSDDITQFAEPPKNTLKSENLNYLFIAKVTNQFSGDRITSFHHNSSLDPDDDWRSGCQKDGHY